MKYRFYRSKKDVANDFDILKDGEVVAIGQPEKYKLFKIREFRVNKFSAPIKEMNAYMPEKV